MPRDGAEDSVSFLSSTLGNANPDGRTTLVNHSNHGEFAYRDGSWKLVFKMSGRNLQQSRGKPTIAELYKRVDTIDDILKGYHHMSGAADHDAISYYLDHQEEIEREIVKNRLETVMTKAGLKIDKRGFLRLTSDPLPK